MARTWNKLMIGDKSLSTYYYPKAIQMTDRLVLCFCHLGSDDVYARWIRVSNSRRFDLK